jgi:hypothetical protein
MTQPRTEKTMRQRWEEDEQMYAETPRQVDAPPRWQEDDLPQYGPDAADQPMPDDLDGSQL